MIVSLQRCVLQFGLDKTYWVAYSGGLDSSVLLSLFAELRRQLPIKLKAIHINHGLSPNASTWASLCATQCQSLQISYLERSVQVNANDGESIEEVARKKRYAVFAKCLEDGDILLTAHHQDDQAETFLLQLLRGAGVKGLAAMPQVKAFARGQHMRPLLEFSRSHLQAYAKERQLVWVDDESNLNLDFARNYIRHQLMPVLLQQWEGASDVIARSAAHCAEAQALLEEYALTDCEKVKGSKRIRSL